MADLVSPYGGETAPNFVEIDVLQDRVQLRFEIDLSDYPVFVAAEGEGGGGPSLADRTGRTVAVAVDGVPVTPVTRLVEVRPRLQRATAASKPAPALRPRSERVVYAVLDFPFQGRPARITLTPPVDADGLPRASIGMLAEHLGVPVTDYRYLSGAETFLPDWDDPWFSRFENPNLTRHHKSPLMSFLTMEPREVRHEVIFRLRDLENWVDTGLGGAETLSPDQMKQVGALAEGFFMARNPVVVDGVALSPSAATVSQISVGVGGLQVLDEVTETNRDTALMGIVMSYPRPELPQEVVLTWELFPEGIDTIPVTVTDPAGGIPAQARREDGEVAWTNFLRTWVEPRARPVTVPPGRQLSLPIAAGVLAFVMLAALGLGLRSRGGRRLVLAGVAVLAMAGAALMARTPQTVTLPGGGLPDARVSDAVLRGVLGNINAAMLEVRPDAYAAALAVFVAEGKTAEVGAEMRRGLSVALPSGAIARADKLLNAEVERVTARETRQQAQFLANWTVLVSGGHWGHLHRRAVTYRGLLDVTRDRNRWYLDGLTILAARTEGGQS